MVLTSRGAATRRRIVTGAAALFRERGVAQVSLDDIRAATATSKSQLFHYFPGGRSELLLAVAEHEAEQVLADQQPLLGDLTDWRKWQAWRERIIKIYDEQRAGCPLSALTAHLSQADPAAAQKIVIRMNERWQAHLATGVRALSDSGEIDPATDPDQTAATIMTAIVGGATLLQATDSMTYLELALTQALNSLRR
ncbi:TetR/AcrR family transcriptional regulator [Actinomadura craniellae]|uniref:TetR/AcrR family transcriptional regulator n=1 Tax=Actinomadura craniellae TaxID=2231787 RepID=A0A365H9E4_9ACTN|nr:TetR/AcrR family transcriptional regulator [Actinomadura craniellae]RAY15628.1 TetR/AcrR family transcriptional regulator [Actinomadura craniellae]